MKIFIPILTLLLGACRLKDSKVFIKTASFAFPVIIKQVKFDTVEEWRTDRINEIFPKFIGQYKFSDTVYFNGGRQQRYIDRKQDEWEHNVFSFDTLSSDGLQIYIDYETTLEASLYQGVTGAQQFFPVYLVNETLMAKEFLAKDGHVFAIQEAVDTSDYNNWYAIEGMDHDFCGNGYFKRRVLPNEFIMFLMPKYSGPDTTYFRTRIEIGENILVSKPYRGSFNKTQFNVSKDNWWADKIKEGRYNWMFYGARNK